MRKVKELKKFLIMFNSYHDCTELIYWTSIITIIICFGLLNILFIPSFIYIMKILFIGFIISTVINIVLVVGYILANFSDIVVSFECTMDELKLKEKK